MKRLLLLVIVCSAYVSYAQTWADDAASIFYTKCAQCHHTGGVAPFPLTTFAEVSPMASFIYGAIDGEIMPPWPPNNNYQSYSHDRSLSATEKTTVLDWINNGAPEGNPANTPPVPVFPIGSLLGNGDLEVQIPTYMSKATAGSDDYVCFAMPSNLATDRVIKAIEIVPGNREIVHHALIYIDPTSSCVTDSVGGDCGGPSSNNATLVMGYTPGSSPLTLPSASPLKLGIDFPAGSQVVFTMHYPEGSYGMYDSTKVIFHFYPPGEPGIRAVYAAPILQDWSFALAPNQVTDLTAQYPAAGGIATNYSGLSVFPHMHLLGKSMKVYGLNPAQDTIKLIDIPEWDFHWQDFYFYKNIQKLETGSVLYAEASFDNTSGNAENPNNPPAWVFPGLNTTDEMFLVYMHFMYYQAGDENYNMDSLMSLGFSSIAAESFGESAFSIYPNPFDESVNLYSKTLNPGDLLSIRVYDTQGKLVRILADKLRLEDEEFMLNWDGKNEAGQNTGSGVYIVSFNVNGTMSHQRIIKR